MAKRRIWMNVAWIALVAVGVGDWLIINLVVGPSAAASGAGRVQAAGAGGAPARAGAAVAATSPGLVAPDAVGARPAEAGTVMAAASTQGSAQQPRVVQAPPTARPAEETAPTGAEAVLAPSSIPFAKQSAALTPEARLTLREAAKALQAGPARSIFLEGHADERGPAELNQWLSRQRALNAKDYLVHLGVEARRIEARGVGSERPIDASQTEEALARNRRVDVTLR